MPRGVRARRMWPCHPGGSYQLPPEQGMKTTQPQEPVGTQQPWQSPSPRLECPAETPLGDLEVPHKKAGDGGTHWPHCPRVNAALPRDWRSGPSRCRQK